MTLSTRTLILVQYIVGPLKGVLFGLSEGQINCVPMCSEGAH